MRLVFAGTPEAAIPALRALLASTHEVVAVLTRPDAPSGRGRRLVPSPVANLANEHGIEVLRPVTPKDPEFLQRLRLLAPECAPVVAYGGLLPPAALRIPTHGWVNLHFSLLPAWRGAAPVHHALLHGDEITGATTFRLVAELDAGPVFGAVTEAVRANDTAGALQARLAQTGAGLLVATLDGIADGTIRAREQPLDGVSLAPKVGVQDAQIRWTDPALAIDRRVRACTPAPGAWTVFRDNRVKVGPLRLRPDVRSLGPGEIAATGHQVLVGGADHAVALDEVQAQGKKPMKAEDWARGVRLAPGDTMTHRAEAGSSAPGVRP